MKTEKFVLLFILCFGLFACSQNPITPLETATPWVEGTQAAQAVASQTATPPASATPWVGGTQTAQAVASQTATPPAWPTFTPIVVEKPTDFSPVLYGGKVYDIPFFLLLGGVGSDTWLTPDMSVSRFAGEVTYSLHTLTQESKYFIWGKTPEKIQTCNSYSIGTDAGLEEAGFVAVVDGWAITKRDVTELSADGEFYQQAVLEWLEAEGVDSPQIDDLHIFRVDLEGDGSDEIFISATRLDDSQHTTMAGDYSIVLMRKIAGNEVVTVPVITDVYSSAELEITFPRTYSIGNFIDLNQDGVLEVVVESRKWEGFGASVYQVNGQEVTQPLAAEC